MPKAAVVHWDLRVEFATKKQAVDAATLLMGLDVDYDFSLSTELTEKSMIYVLNINDMSWANNLAPVAEILDSVDFKGA